MLYNLDRLQDPSLKATTHSKPEVNPTFDNPVHHYNYGTTNELCPNPHFSFGIRFHTTMTAKLRGSPIKKVYKVPYTNFFLEQILSSSNFFTLTLTSPPYFTRRVYCRASSARLNRQVINLRQKFYYFFGKMRHIFLFC